MSRRGDLQFSSQASNSTGSATLTFVIPRVCDLFWPSLSVSAFGFLRWVGEQCRRYAYSICENALAFVNQKYQQNNAHDERQTPHQDFEALDERRSCHVITASLHR